MGLKECSRSDVQVTVCKYCKLAGATDQYFTISVLCKNCWEYVGQDIYILSCIFQQLNDIKFHAVCLNASDSQKRKQLKSRVFTALHEINF
jgi:hypothetical protein